MKKIILAGTAALTLLAGCQQPSGGKTYENADVKLNNFTDSLSLSLGTLVAKNIVQSVPSEEIKAGKLNRDVFFQAMNNYFETGTEAIDEQAMMQIVQKFSQQQGESYKIKNEEYLKSNSTKEGYTVTASGLQYKVLKAAKGVQPKNGNRAKIHVLGKHVDGKAFENTFEQKMPVTVTVGTTLRGLDEALRRMSVGEKWELYIPAQLGFGQRGSPPLLGPNETLIYEVQLLEILEK